MRKVIRASKRSIKADTGDQIIDLLGLLYDVTDKYNTSHPISGDWDTEANHEMLTIADAFNISAESAKALMINELGFSERDFRMYNNLNGSTNIEEEGSELEVKRIPMYGDYECSCGCGQMLGHPINDGPAEICIGVGRKDDDEGFDWRMFTRECWNKLRRRNFSLEDIYDKFPESCEV